MPIVIKTISIIGTIAMLAVGGGIVAHETHVLHFLEHSIENLGNIAWLVSFILEVSFGFVVGFITVKVLPFLNLFIKKIRPNK